MPKRRWSGCCGAPHTRYAGSQCAPRASPARRIPQSSRRSSPPAPPRRGRGSRGGKTVLPSPNDRRQGRAVPFEHPVDRGRSTAGRTLAPATGQAFMRIYGLTLDHMNQLSRAGLVYRPARCLRCRARALAGRGPASGRRFDSRSGCRDLAPPRWLEQGGRRARRTHGRNLRRHVRARWIALARMRCSGGRQAASCAASPR